MTEVYYRRSGGVASRVVDGEALLVKSDENKVYVLNGTGSRMWIAADGTKQLGEIAGDIDPECARDFLEELAGLNLIESSATPWPEPALFPQAVEWPREEHEEPRIVAAEEMEVLASVCDSTFGGASGCRLVGTCINAYT